MNVNQIIVKDKIRINLVDALRGFALLGIVLIHNIEHFDTVFSPEAETAFGRTIDEMVKHITVFMIGGKAYAIFALLFGFSFSLQYERKRLQGQDFCGRFVWRLCLLFCFGVFHVIFYQGEILSIYAIVGLLLVLIRRADNRVLIALAIFFMLQPWETGGLLYALLNPDYVPIAYPRQYFEMTQIAQTKYSFWELAKVNLTDGFTNAHIFAWRSGRYMQTASLMLIGFWLGRKSLFLQSSESNTFWKKSAILFPIIFIPLYLLNVYLPEWKLPGNIFSHLQVIVTSLSKAAFTGVVVSVFVLLWFHSPVQKVFSKLEPFGKMSLTNYIGSSIIGSFVYYYYGLDMYKHLSIVPSLLVGITVFILLLSFSRLWLGNHKQGPIEWLWHKLTWIKLKRE